MHFSKLEWISIASVIAILLVGFWGPKNSASNFGIETTNQTGGTNVISDARIQYYNDSQLGPNGLSIETDGSLILRSQLSDLITPYISTNGNQLTFKCDANAMNSYRSAIQLDSRFPFAYYYLGFCDKKEGNLGWRTEIEKAQSILQITTDIPGHNGNQDLLLKDVNSLLSQ